MTTFSTSVEINASAQNVFKALVDFESYHQWHPSVAKVKGVPELNEWVTVFLNNR